jgi:hypothetical protein
VSYQLVFWVIVLAYQFAALDSLQNWQFSRAAWDYIGRAAKRAEATFTRLQQDEENSVLGS